MTNLLEILPEETFLVQKEKEYNLLPKRKIKLIKEALLMANLSIKSGQKLV